MGNTGFPVLCGGTFFTLLLEAAKHGLKERKKWGKSGEFAETDVFETLLQVGTDYQRPSDDKNFGSAVSAYKSCNTKKSGRLLITQQAVIATFDGIVKSNYQAPLEKMASLVDKYMDTDGKGIWLAKALLDLIKQSVAGDSRFYADESGAPLDKDALCSKSEFFLPALLLGVWHYIVVSRIDNATGRDTYDGWCKPGISPNTREDFESDIGSGITQQIRLIVSEFPQSKLETAGAETSAASEGEPYDDYSEPFAEDPAPDPAQNITNQIINAPAVFFNSGANVMQINNTGTLNIDRGGKT